VTPSHPALAATGLCLALPVPASASFITLDADDASRPAYDDGWDNFADGSIAPDLLGGWVFGGNAAGNVSIASAAGNGGGASIDAAGESFRMLNPNGVFVDVFRFIDPAGLQPGQTLSFDLDVNFRSGFKGVDARRSDESNLFNLNIGGDDYVVNDVTTGGGSVGDDYNADTVFSIALDQTSSTGGTWTVTRSGGINDVDTGTFSGVVRSLKFYSGGGQGDSSADAMYFNNFAITVIPEPLAAGAAGVLGLVTLRRRRGPAFA